MSERPEGDREVEGRTENEGSGVGLYPGGIRVRAARLREHAGAEVDTRDPSLTQGPENQHARPGTAAHVQSRAERPEFGQRVGGRAENALRGAKGRVVELRSQQIVAALDRGQCLDAQLT